ncbi:MAG: squalene/phytoene synthase family protein [Verrucomicrobiae bacterium]|nr:squalene/phytoene synthase family protein [Verrucomicrobiae bacterium]
MSPEEKAGFFNNSMTLALTKKVARSFYLSIRLLPSTLREPVALAYLLARASDTVVDEEDDLISESERELLRLLPSLIEELNDPQRNHFDADAIKVVWQTILEGQAFDLERFSLDLLDNSTAEAHCGVPPVLASSSMTYTLSRCAPEAPSTASPAASSARGLLQDQVSILNSDELDRYLYLVAGCVGEFWTKLAVHHLPDFSKESLETMMARGVDYGKGLQLVNILRDRQKDARCGRHYCKEDQVPQLHVQALAYLQQGEAYVKALRPGRFKVATALPLLLGKRTLALIKKYPNAEKVKISRCVVYLTLLRAACYLFW